MKGAIQFCLSISQSGKHRWILLFALLLPVLIQAQDEIPIPAQGPIAAEADPDSGKTAPKVEIIDAGLLDIIQDPEERVRILWEKVHLRQGDVELYSDSAVFYPDRNDVLAFGNVHIIQADSIHAYGDSLTYDGNARMARLMGNVRLQDSRMQLKTNQLQYDLSTRIGSYWGGGILYNLENRSTLESEIGYYYARSERAFFRDSVRLDHPDYNLQADTLEYQVQKDLAIFHGPTYIQQDDSEIYCESGFYDGIAGTALFQTNAVLNDPPRRVEADSIVYDRAEGLGKAYGNVWIQDTAQDISQRSEFAEFNEQSGLMSTPTRSLVAIQMEADTFLLAADTLNSDQDSLGNRRLWAYGRVRIYRSDLQGICDSLVWMDADSNISLFGDPILWSEKSQFLADTQIIYMAGSEVTKVDLKRNAFIISEADTLLYDQIKGRDIFGNFKDGDIYQLLVEGNAESMYWGKDDKDAILGVNESLCSRMDIRLKEGEVENILFLGDPTAHFRPIQKIDPKTKKLSGFRWLENLRPRSAQDLINPKVKSISVDSLSVDSLGSDSTLIDPEASINVVDEVSDENDHNHNEGDHEDHSHNGDHSDHDDAGNESGIIEEDEEP